LRLQRKAQLSESTARQLIRVLLDAAEMLRIAASGALSNCDLLFWAKRSLASAR